MREAFNIDFVESYDKETIIRELQRLANSLGKTTLSYREINAHGRLSAKTVIKRFGSLRQAMEESGLSPGRYRNVTNDELCSILVQLWTQTLEKYGRSPFAIELKRFGFNVSDATYRSRFGSWNKALLASAASVTNEDDVLITTPQGTKETESGDRKNISIRKRFLVFKRDRYRCRLCKRSGIELEVDHRIPVAEDGTDALDNLQTLCWDCNRGKRNSLE